MLSVTVRARETNFTLNQAGYEHSIVSLGVYLDITRGKGKRERSARGAHPLAVGGPKATLLVTAHAHKPDLLVIPTCYGHGIASLFEVFQNTARQERPFHGLHYVGGPGQCY